MRIPEVVKSEARGFIEDYDAKLKHIGEYKGYEVYFICFPEDMLTGYPIIFMYKEGEPVWELQYEAEQFFGDDVFEIMRIAAKNTRDRRKAARMANKD